MPVISSSTSNGGESFPLTGSALDVGYLTVTVVLNNSTRVPMMLSTRSRSSFLRCSQSVLNSCGDNDCGILSQSSPKFIESFVGAYADGRYLKGASLCLGEEWCSVAYRSAIGSENGTDASQATPPQVGCSQTLSGSLRDQPELGVWGIGPDGLHPTKLTLCFGTKKNIGRITPRFESDTLVVSPPWVNFRSNFQLESELVRSPVQFKAPETVWEDQPADATNDTKVVTRIDFSSTYSWIPPKWFSQAKHSLVSACDSLGCRGYRDYSDGSAMVCFRFKELAQEDFLPDLEWRLEDEVHILVPPSRYLFTTEDGSRCVGLFESADVATAVFGLNMLTGLRLRIDYVERRLKIDTCFSRSSTNDDTTATGFPATSGDDGSTTPDATTTGSSWGDDVKVLLALVAFVGGIALGVACAVRLMKRKHRFTLLSLGMDTTAKRKQKKTSIFRAAKYNFASSRQRTKRVTFSEDLVLSSSSDEEEMTRGPFYPSDDDEQMLREIVSGGKGDLSESNISAEGRQRRESSEEDAGSSHSFSFSPLQQAQPVPLTSMMNSRGEEDDQSKSLLDGN